MNSKFSPKFTIVTPYPMMFAEEDLKCIELDIINTLMSDDTYAPPESPEHLCHEALTTFADLGSPLWAEEPEWLQQTKQYLDYLWEIDITSEQETGSIWPSTVDPIFPRE